MSKRNQAFSRRDLLRSFGATMAGAGLLSAQDAAHVHHMVAEEKAASGVYTPKAFTEHEYATLRRLSELIIPPDEKSKGALDAGAPEFIDFLSSRSDEMKQIYTGGIAWLDEAMRHRHNAAFVDAGPEQQTQLLDLIAYRKNDSPELGPGIKFFSWVRNMTVDAYYTSKIGWNDLGYMGNSGMTKFEVPVEAVEYALKRSGLG